jgi:predicted nucleic acid-binding protein
MLRRALRLCRRIKLSFPALLGWRRCRLLSRRDREYPENLRDHESARRSFRSGWDGLIKVDVRDDVLSLAGVHVGEYALRAYDSVLRATAILFQKAMGQVVAFSSFDHNLNQAAEHAGLTLIRV